MTIERRVVEKEEKTSKGKVSKGFRRSDLTVEHGSTVVRGWLNVRSSGLECESVPSARQDQGVCVSIVQRFILVLSSPRLDEASLRPARRFAAVQLVELRRCSPSDVERSMYTYELDKVPNEPHDDESESYRSADLDVFCCRRSKKVRSQHMTRSNLCPSPAFPPCAEMDGQAGGGR